MHNQTHLAATRHALAYFSMALLAGCGGGGSSSGTSASTNTVPSTPTTGAATADTQYSTVYRTLSFGASIVISYNGQCSMSLSTTGVPEYHADYYLNPPTTAYPTVVAQTPVSRLQLAVIPYQPALVRGASGSINICPAKAAATTAAGLGVIGYMISGQALFNPYEGGAGMTPAMSDNVTYTFMDVSGTSQTAAFIDRCNSHPTPLNAGYSWHYHGVPFCVTQTADVGDGPSHIIGIALDGFPIYGGRDISGNVISVSQLDACNGITSATPEFPQGAYHYVLPINETGNRSSLNCFSGTVTQVQLAMATAAACNLRLARLIESRDRRRMAQVRPTLLSLQVGGAS